MVYADRDDWAIQQNYATFITYTTANPDGWTQAKIDFDLAKGTRIINRIVNPENPGVDITNTAYLDELKDLNIEMANRMHDKDISRKSQTRNIYSPHDHLYERERIRLFEISGIIETRLVGGAGRG